LWTRGQEGGILRSRWILPTAEGFTETATPLISFKPEAVERLLAQHQSALTLPQYQHIQRWVERGAEGINAHVLIWICRLLKCLPTDIMQTV